MRKLLKNKGFQKMMCIWCVRGFFKGLIVSDLF